jgi:hypothetical protein
MAKTILFGFDFPLSHCSEANSYHTTAFQGNENHHFCNAMGKSTVQHAQLQLHACIEVTNICGYDFI